MLTPTTPKDGDIIVREEQRAGTRVYVLHTAPSAGQCVLATWEDAVAQALACARREGVRAWLTGEGDAFDLLEDFRDGIALAPRRVMV